MFKNITDIFKNQSDDSSPLDEFDDDNENLFARDNTRFAANIEEELGDIIDALRTTLLPFNSFYFCMKHKQSMLVTHPFINLEAAKEFEEKLTNIFKSTDIEIIQDEEGRYFIHMNPRKIKEDEFERCLNVYSTNLFKVPEYRFDNKNRSEVKLLLDSLKTTDMPMDTMYFNHQSNVYYLISHAFNVKERVEEYIKYYKETFGSFCVTLVEDISGRFFMHMNPSAIRKDKYQEFYEQHQLELFKKNKHLVKESNKFECTLSDAKYMLICLRYTKYPMSSVVYDKRTDDFFLLSHVFSISSRADGYETMFADSFSKEAVKKFTDFQGRSFIYLNPFEIDKTQFKTFLEKNAVDIFKKI